MTKWASLPFLFDEPLIFTKKPHPQDEAPLLQ